MTPETPIARRNVEVLNALGVHFRPANKFVSVAMKFQSEIRVSHNGQEVNGKSMLELPLLAAEKGARLDIEARGDDAEAAVTALAELVTKRFFENDQGDSVEESL
jgi:phosphocarrier protein